jgi:hypothetical protein
VSEYVEVLVTGAAVVEVVDVVDVEVVDDVVGEAGRVVVVDDVVGEVPDELGAVGDVADVVTGDEPEDADPDADVVPADPDEAAPDDTDPDRAAPEEPAPFPAASPAVVDVPDSVVVVLRPEAASSSGVSSITRRVVVTATRTSSLASAVSWATDAGITVDGCSTVLRTCAIAPHENPSAMNTVRTQPRASFNPFDMVEFSHGSRYTALPR